MMLRELELVEFRNLAAARLELGERFTVLWGHNGAGKTNVLEAIYLLSTLRSFRTNDLGSLVRGQATGAAVRARGFDERLELPSTLSVQLLRSGNTTRRSAHADDKLVRTAADFYGRLRAVLFTPEDLAVLRESPSQRRQFIDRMLFARERSHIVDVQVYERLLRARNHVLRNESLAPVERDAMLDTYEVELAETGARIWSRRAELLDLLTPGVLRGFAEIHGGSGPQPGTREAIPELGLEYVVHLGEVPPSQRREALATRLRERRELDRQRGTTSVGPHRDDVRVQLERRPVAEFASQGQTRAIVLALKLAELELVDATGTKPLLLLDDVSSELDPERSDQLFTRLGELAGQCVLTTTATRFVRLPAAAPSRWVAVERGELHERGAGG
jgi:DNA replication and repair protein RecF